MKMLHPVVLALAAASLMSTTAWAQVEEEEDHRMPVPELSVVKGISNATFEPGAMNLGDVLKQRVDLHFEGAAEQTVDVQILAAVVQGGRILAQRSLGCSDPSCDPAVDVGPKIGPYRFGVSGDHAVGLHPLSPQGTPVVDPAARVRYETGLFDVVTRQQPGASWQVGFATARQAEAPEGAALVVDGALNAEVWAGLADQLKLDGKSFAVALVALVAPRREAAGLVAPRRDFGPVLLLPIAPAP